MSISIVKTPGTAGGKPRIDGHRIRVQDIAVWHEYLGYTPDEIVAYWDSLNLAEVHAALSYYYEHREQIEADIAAEEEFVEEMKRKFPSPLMKKIAGLSEGGSSTSS
ncbi:MAG: DUF433 domain-containing protein [Candidatus Hydrogenedentales bacterium]